MYTHTTKTKTAGSYTQTMHFFHYIPLKNAGQRSIKLGHNINGLQPQFFEKHWLKATGLLPKDEETQ